MKSLTRKNKISVHGKTYEINLDEKDDYLDMVTAFKEKFPTLLKHLRIVMKI